MAIDGARTHSRRAGVYYLSIHTCRLASAAEDLAGPTRRRSLHVFNAVERQVVRVVAVVSFGVNSLRVIQAWNFIITFLNSNRNERDAQR